MSTIQNASQPPAVEAQLLISTLPEQHVIYTLVKEHLHFLAILKQIMKARAQLLKCDTPEDAKGPLKDIARCVQVLMDADSHHQREERALFPMVKEMGHDAMHTDMIREHDHLRAMKKNLLRLTTTDMGSRTFTNQRAVIAGSCERFAANLVAHIQKEDSTIYPIALKVIKDAQDWEKLRIECDNIGYGPELSS